MCAQMKINILNEAASRDDAEKAEENALKRVSYIYAYIRMCVYIDYTRHTIHFAYIGFVECVNAISKWEKYENSQEIH